MPRLHVNIRTLLKSPKTRPAERRVAFALAITVTLALLGALTTAGDSSEVTGLGAAESGAGASASEAPGIVIHGPAQTAVTPSPRLSEADIELLARLIHAEAEGEPYTGKVAVGAVVLNRVESERFPDSVREVVYAHGQFSVVPTGRINRPASAESLAAARAAAAGDDPSRGALYFFAPAKTSDAFVWSRPHLVTIGNHRFTG